MSKDMLGSVVRAAVGVPQDRMDVLAKIASAMAADSPAGRAWHECFKAQLEQGLPKVEPKRVVELGEFIADYDETIAAKLAVVTDPKVIGWRTDLATDEKFPDVRKNKKRYRASAVHFGRPMGQDVLEDWCRQNKKILATPKQGIDLARISPRPKLDEVMPLALTGQFFVAAVGRRGALFFVRGGGERHLSHVWLNPDGQWDDHWWFLVLEELPLEV